MVRACTARGVFSDLPNFWQLPDTYSEDILQQKRLEQPPEFYYSL